MKNIILGLVGSLIIVYTVAVTLGVYNMNTRKNELDNCISDVLETVMIDYYGDGFQVQSKLPPSSEYVSQRVVLGITERVKNSEDLTVAVPVCDIEKGIISVRLKESFILPGGIEKEINCRKTIIVDREER